MNDITEYVDKQAEKKKQELREDVLNPLVAAILDGKDIDPDKLDKILAVQERYEANEARKAYARAMAAFRTEVPDIKKDARVNFSSGKGTTDYRHTTLGYVLTVINPVLGEHGFSPSWKTVQGDKGVVSVTCTITHAMGHAEKNTLSSFPDQSGNKNNIQAIGSTVTYLERYTLFALCGLASSNQDDDGQKGGGNEVKKISEEQALQIHALIDEHQINREKFVQWLIRAKHGPSIDDININSHSVVLAQINHTIARLAQARKNDASD